jgi:hypothetical protein
MLQGCTPHLQGWHHPPHSLQSNSTSPHLQGWKHPLILSIGLALAPPLKTFSHWQPLSVIHQSLLAPGPIQRNPSPPPAPPAADIHLPSLPPVLPWPAPSTRQHQSLMKTRATSLNGANCEPTPPSPLPGIPPMQTNWGAYAKALALAQQGQAHKRHQHPLFHSLRHDPSQPPQGNHLLQVCLQGLTR